LNREAAVPIVKTSPKGQVVVPAEIRELIGLGPGDLVMVSHAGGRRVILEPVADDPVASVKGMLRHGPSLTAALRSEREEEHVRQTETVARLVRGPRAPE
jgi:AbrB family looped-hinge helix DNA binding protein